MKSLLLIVVAAVAVTANPQFGSLLNRPAAIANTAGGIANTAAGVAGGVTDALRSTFLKSFGDFQSSFNKVYATPELAAQAQELFIGNFKGIEDHNKLFAQGSVTFKQGVNEFFDGDLLKILTGLCGTVVPNNVEDEITEKRRTKRAAEKPSPKSFPPGPDSVDFSSNLQPVVHQGSCGGCWTFAAVAQIEALYSRKSGSDYKISQQELLDCTEDTKGCNGGWPKKALDFILNNGVTLNSSYPYKNEKETCNVPTAENTLPSVAEKSVQYKLKGDEDSLKNILASEGPVVVVISATEGLMKYAEGVFSDPDCSSSCKKVNHAVLLVGYGTDGETGKPYWLIRNSWGTTWGEKGYFKLLRDGTNHCGTSCYAMYLKA